MMTKEDWKYVQDNWGDIREEIKLKIDGYDIVLQSGILKLKIIVTCYVNGYVKGVWLSKNDDQYPEEGRKFYQLHRRGFLSSQSLKQRRKIFGKKSEWSQQYYYEYLTPNWSSFSAFKKHIIENNKDIELIRS